MSRTLISTDPATGAIVWEGPAATALQVRQAVEKARRAFPGWSATPLEQRIDLVRAYKAVLEMHANAMAETISRETGKPLWESRAELGSMIGKIDLSIAARAERAGERRIAMPLGEAVLRHRPHGVMAVLGPYNFPGHLPNGHIVPALLAGNCAVFKPSELTPASGEAMASAWAEAGLPDGVFSLVQGGRETGAALSEANIDGLLFTGSAASGAHLRRIFSERPKVIVALELGGNNPLVVWDGDVEEAAAIAVQSAYVTTGQRCSCARRLIVPDTRFGSAVIDAVAALADHLTIGAWNDLPETYMGPLISCAAAYGVRNRVSQLVSSGARVIRPLGRPEGRSDAFVTPALLDVNCIAVPDQELFAPVLQVTRASDFDAALAQANATRFGLAAGLVSEDEALWRRFVREVRAGVVNRNRPMTGASGAMPFGGLGESGSHRPSAFYAADYCAYPVASFEAASAVGNADALGQWGKQ
jgi:succinylglutamic semialdehyde dehydrogenase